MKFNEDLFFNSIIQLLISIIIRTIVLYTSYKLIEKYLRKKHEIEIDNTAYGILCSAILFSVGYLISGIKDPIINSIDLIQRNPDFSGSVVFEGLKYSGLFLSIISCSLQCPGMTNFLINFTFFLIAVMNMKEA